MLACFLTKPSRIIRERKSGNQVLQESGRMDRTPSSRPSWIARHRLAQEWIALYRLAQGTDRSRLVDERHLQAIRSPATNRTH